MIHKLQFKSLQRNEKNPKFIDRRMTTQKRFSGFKSFCFPFFQELFVAKEIILKIRISRNFRIRLWQDSAQNSPDFLFFVSLQYFDVL